MTTHFSSNFFINNRARLRALVVTDAPIVLAANGLLQKQADSPYPFAQDQSFWYLTGLDEPDLVLVMDRTDEYILAPVRDAVRTAFDGVIDTAALSETSGIGDIVSMNDGWTRLDTRLQQTKRVATLTPASAFIEQSGMFANPARTRLVAHLKTVVPELAITDISSSIARLRMIKQPLELAAIQQAIDATISGLQYVFDGLRQNEFEYEYEIEARLTYAFRGRGLRGHAFDPIVASGIRACTLHNVANNGRLASGELILLDVGAEFDHYAADLSRTVSRGIPTKRQQQVYDAVQNVHAYALGLLKPGIILKEYERQVHEHMGIRLQQLGLITEPTSGNIGQFFPHSTSHHLGLAVHDAALYNEPLVPGMALTVEPGMYIPTEAIGIRLEDDVVITDTGCTVLSSQLAASLTN